MSGSAPASNGTASTPLEAALKEADKTIKRQKTCAAKTTGLLYKIIHSIEQCIKNISEDPNVDPAVAVEELGKAVDALDAVAAISSDTKELHGAVGKLGKIIDKDFSTDICGALRQFPMDKDIMDRVIAEHLYHEGAFEVADAFVAEAGIKDGDALKAPYVSMYAVLEQLRQHNLGPALAWVEENKTALRKNSAAAPIEENGGVIAAAPASVGTAPSSFEFSLHRIAFLQTLEQNGQSAALDYARQHFPAFEESSLRDIQRLMGALCYQKRAKLRAAQGITPSSPYTDLFDGEQLWEELGTEFQRQFCGLMGQAQDSPLLVTAAAGAVALPTLLKLASVFSKTQPKSDLTDHNNELPVEVPLGKEFVFHSIFACPVSREQSSDDNPPMMLPCGHVLCRHSIHRVAKAQTRAFKCPYCPKEATIAQCMVLHFPDMK